MTQRQPLNDKIYLYMMCLQKEKGEPVVRTWFWEAKKINMLLNKIDCCFILISVSL